MKRSFKIVCVLIGVALGITFCFILRDLNKYSDHKLEIKQDKPLNLFASNYLFFEARVVGKETSTYSLSIKYKGYEIFNGIDVDSSSIDRESLLKIDSAFQKIYISHIGYLPDSLLPDLVMEIIKTSKIKVTLTARNTDKLDKIITKNFSLNIKSIPIAAYTDLSLKKSGSKEWTAPYNSLVYYEPTRKVWAKDLKEKFPNESPNNIQKAALLFGLFKKYGENVTYDKFYLTVDDKSKNEISNAIRIIPVLEAANEIDFSINIDTFYNQTFIYPFPSDLNFQVASTTEYDYYSMLDHFKSQYSLFSKLNTQGIITHQNGSDYKYNISYKLIADAYPKVNKSIIGLYLVNISENGNYFITEVADYIIDKQAPLFVNDKNYSFKGDPRFEGLVALSTMEFYGFNPHSVPFVGKVYGDVKEIFIDGTKVPFTLGEDVYFKKKIYLDGGYNRIRVKVIDNTGNIAESFIEITMESMNKDD